MYDFKDTFGRRVEFVRCLANFEGIHDLSTWKDFGLTFELGSTTNHFEYLLNCVPMAKCLVCGCHLSSHFLC